MSYHYSLDHGQDAIRKAFGVDREEISNLSPMPAIFRGSDGRRSFTLPTVSAS